MSNLTNIKFKDGDEDGSETEAAENISIETVANGWIVKVVDGEGDEYTEVYNFESSSNLITAIKEALGAPGA